MCNGRQKETDTGELIFSVQKLSLGPGLEVSRTKSLSPALSVTGEHPGLVAIRAVWLPMPSQPFFCSVESPGVQGLSVQYCSGKASGTWCEAQPEGRSVWAVSGQRPCEKDQGPVTGQESLLSVLPLYSTMSTKGKV